MEKGKTLIVVLAILPMFAFGCASGGMKKPTVFVDKANNIPADIPSQFPNRYERFISSKELKEFNKLLTDEERQAFVDKFWLERDTDPATPENEEKQRIDELIDNIADEPFLSAPGVFGLSFRTNGGFRGDMAKVYLLHGEPDAMDTIESERQSFVNLMLWIYANPENGGILYAFLFYQKGGGGSYLMFHQDAYQMDPCGALYEVATSRMRNYFGSGMQGCTDDLYQVYNDIYYSNSRAGILDGSRFAWALFNFSQSGSNLQGVALSPPKPASEMAKQSNSRVTGEAPKLIGTPGVDYILASCDKCNSMIPAEFSIADKQFVVSSSWKNFDWVVRGEYLELSLKYRITLENSNKDQPIVFEGPAGIRAKRSFLNERPEATIILDLLNSEQLEQVAATPSGTYQVSVYIKNMTTNKYNAWHRELTK